MKHSRRGAARLREMSPWIVLCALAAAPLAAGGCAQGCASASPAGERTAEAAPPQPQGGAPAGATPAQAAAKDGDVVPFAPKGGDGRGRPGRAEGPPEPDACLESTAPFAQPIAVVEDQRISRWPPVLGFPIAFARSAGVRSLRGFFATTKGGTPLPTQLEVLSRWGDGPGACEAPIRWAYAHVLADVPPGQRAYLVLRHAPGHAAADVGPTLSIETRGDAVVVDTGPARFTIAKAGFNGLARVERLTAQGPRTIVDAPSATGVGMVIEQGNRRFSPVGGKLLSFEVEREGPYLATIAVKGTYAAAEGAPIAQQPGKGGRTPGAGGDGGASAPAFLRYTVRLSFYAGTAVVGIDHTFYNGEVTDITANGGKKLVTVDRAVLRLPLALGARPAAVARAAAKVHELAADRPIAVLQAKRSPSRPNVVSAVKRGHETVETASFADRPLLALSGAGGAVAATIGWMGPRDPQALRWDPGRGSLDLEWQSEPMAIGGARGIWSKAVVDFAAPTGAAALATRGTQLYAHATRPLIGVPSVAYLNTTRARGSLPDGELPSDYARFDNDVDHIHENTARYARKYRITGLQIWPDLQRAPCEGARCQQLEEGYYEGGDCNYWDWSKIEADEFFRSADPAFLHDFVVPEAITMAETVSFRPDDFTRSVDSSFGGFSPCYGSGRGWDGPWVEGLNHRTGNCPGDYSYNKIHQYAYILTADRRFTDFFLQGANTAIRMYRDPTKGPPTPWLELTAARTMYQYLEQLLNGAEFARAGDAENRRLRDALLLYFDHMAKNSLAGGHVCDLLGTGEDDPRKKGTCPSDQAWMTPVWIDWVARVAAMYDHAPAKRWLVDFARNSIQRFTAVDGDGRPDLGLARAASDRDSGNGWRTVYRCKAGTNGIVEESCAKRTDMENNAYFYSNGLVAFLNSFGLVLDAVPEDPLHLCAWLPSAYRTALRNLEGDAHSDIWGKELGQAYAMAQTSLAAIERCGKR